MVESTNTTSNLIFTPPQPGQVDSTVNDLTPRIELSTYQQSNGGNPFGDLIRLIWEGARAKGGIKWYADGTPAMIVSTLLTTTTGTFNITAGTNIVIAVDGVSYNITFTSTTVMTISINGGPSATLTRSSPWFVDLAAATNDEVARALTSALNPLDANNNSGVTLSSTVTMVDSQAQCLVDILNFGEFDRIIISSPIQGVVSTIKVTGGTAGAALGFTNEASPVASANLLTLAVSGNRVFPITGSTTLNMIVNTSWTVGDVIALKFGSPINVFHNTGTSTSVNNRIYLKNKLNWFAAAGDILYLRNGADADGGNNLWYECGRTVGNDTRVQKTWIISHDQPTNVSSENQHQHLSIEATDWKGDMQTRLGIIYGSNLSLVTVTSADFAVNGGRILVDPTSGIVGTSDITPQNKVRRWRIRTNSTTENLDLQIYDNTGATSTTLMSLDRASLSTVMAAGALQTKYKGSTNAVASTLPITPANGNKFIITGTGTARRIDKTGWIAGAEISIVFTTAAAILQHNAVDSGNAVGFYNFGLADKTVGANGAIGTFWYDTTLGVSGLWRMITWSDY